jgi:hypothetical protein
MTLNVAGQKVYLSDIVHFIEHQLGLSAEKMNVREPDVITVEAVLHLSRQGNYLDHFTGGLTENYYYMSIDNPDLIIGLTEGPVTVFIGREGQAAFDYNPPNFAMKHRLSSTLMYPSYYVRRIQKSD